MGYPYIGEDFRIVFKIQVVESPVMGKVGSDKHDVAGLEAFHIVTDELGAATFFEMDEFHFGVEMPFVVDIRYEIASNTEGVIGLL